MKKELFETVTNLSNYIEILESLKGSNSFFDYMHYLFFNGYFYETINYLRMKRSDKDFDVIKEKLISGKLPIHNFESFAFYVVPYMVQVSVSGDVNQDCKMFWSQTPIIRQNTIKYQYDKYVLTPIFANIIKTQYNDIQRSFVNGLFFRNSKKEKSLNLIIYLLNYYVLDNIVIYVPLSFNDFNRRYSKKLESLRKKLNHINYMRFRFQFRDNSCYYRVTYPWGGWSTNII